MNYLKIGALTLFGSVVLSGCNSNGGGTASVDNQELRQLATSAGLDGDAIEDKTIPAITDPLAQLGMKLFFSKGLGGDQDAACVTCHHPALGGGDGLSLPVGVQAEDVDHLGFGRTHSQAKANAAGMDYDGGPTVPRNAPTTFNIVLWKDGLFHDSRVEKLKGTPGIRTPDSSFGVADPNAETLSQAQALFPVTSPEEMRSIFLDGSANQVVRDGLAARFVDQTIPNTWLGEFQAAFNSTDDAATLITYANIAKAMSIYEDSQVFVATPWKSYLEGDDGALTESAKRGATLFLTSADEGGAGCISCHSDDFFTDEKSHVVAIPQIGRGKGDGINGNDDFGRMRETTMSNDQYAFRTPTLLNVAVTGPFGHSGAYDTLEGIVRHHLNPEMAIDGYDFTLTGLQQQNVQHDNAEENTRLALAQITALQASGDSLLQTISLGDQQVDDLLSFLNALTDPCVENRACLSSWVPDTNSSGIDGLQLNAIDQNGDLL